MLKHKIRPLLPHAALLLAHQKGLLATAAGAVWWQCCAAYLLCISILQDLVLQLVGMTSSLYVSV